MPLFLYAIGIWLICAITGNRIHFIEISDQDWCPQLFRQCIRNSLHYGWVFFDLSDYFGSPASTLSKIMTPYFNQLNCNLIIDLCSGSGGPTPNIHSILNQTRTVQTILTDLFPQISIWKYQCSKTKHLSFASNSVNAASVQLSTIPEISAKDQDEVHFRTLFGSFHHFRPNLAISILANAMECNDAFIMSEAILRRQSIFDFIQWPFQLIILCPLFIIYMIFNYLYVYDTKEITLKQKLIKCILIMITAPIWVAIIMHDAIISTARCYTEKELIELSESAKAKLKQKLSNKDQDRIQKIDDYEWKCWRQNSDMIFPLGHAAPITVLLGVPKMPSSN